MAPTKGKVKVIKVISTEGRNDHTPGYYCNLMNVYDWTKDTESFGDIDIAVARAKFLMEIPEDKRSHPYDHIVVMSETVVRRIIDD